MSLTAFAASASTVGLAASWAVFAGTFAAPIESPPVLIALFAGVFPPVFAAALAHPKKEVDGTVIRVRWTEIVKSAPPWATGLVLTCIAALVASVYQVPEIANGTSASFQLTRAALVGRPDRVRFIAASCACWYAIGLWLALSARALRIKMGLPWQPP